MTGAMNENETTDFSAYVRDLTRQIDLVEILQKYTMLTDIGRDTMFGMCPFSIHVTSTEQRGEEITFKVSKSRGLYHCDRCEKGGDLMTFLQDFLKLSFEDAIKWIQITLYFKALGPIFDQKIDIVSFVLLRSREPLKARVPRISPYPDVWVKYENQGKGYP